MTRKYIIIFMLISLTIFAFQNGTITVKKPKDAGFENGEKLFKRNCAVCHSTSNLIVTGPGLAGVTKRLKMSWIIKWTKNSDALIKSGDKYAVKISDAYKFPQPIFEYLSDDDIKAIFIYVDSVNKNINY